MEKIDYSKITDNPKVIELLKKRRKIEKQISELDKKALLNYELEMFVKQVYNI